MKLFNRNKQFMPSIMFAPNKENCEEILTLVNMNDILKEDKKTYKLLFKDNINAVVHNNILYAIYDDYVESLLLHNRSKYYNDFIVYAEVRKEEVQTNYKAFIIDICKDIYEGRIDKVKSELKKLSKENYEIMINYVEYIGNCTRYEKDLEYMYEIAYKYIINNIPNLLLINKNIKK